MRVCIRLLIVACSVLAAACSSKGPVPRESQAVNALEKIQKVAEETCGKGRVAEVQQTLFRCK
jgi:hypothetical protein